jgi:hypothetical protein
MDIMVSPCELAMYTVAAVLPESVVTIGLLYTGKRFLLQLDGVHEATSDAVPFVFPVAVAVDKGTVAVVLTPFNVVFTDCVCTAAVTV